MINSIQLRNHVFKNSLSLERVILDYIARRPEIQVLREAILEKK